MAFLETGRHQRYALLGYWICVWYRHDTNLCDNAWAQRGILAWMLFLSHFIYGRKALVTPHKDRITNYFIFSSLLLALYLWIVAVFYVPNIVNLSFAFLFTGIFVAMFIKGGL